MAKPKHANPPTVAAQFRELPGTQVGFWVVDPCPYCGAAHFHAAGARLADPMERLGLTTSPCGKEYILTRPQDKRKKKSKKASRRYDPWEEDDKYLEGDD